ncbi:hypothetical protein Q3G72_030082 [Acer saccharum]|nr:hypothetical protein Q3G72_030082 [Acer saccharum]
MGNSRRWGTKGKQVSKDGGRPSKKRKPSVPVIGSPKGKDDMDDLSEEDDSEDMDYNEQNLGDDPDAEGHDQGPKLNQIIQTLEGLCLQMDANQKANMTEFANLNRRMDAFQKALVHSGLQFQYVRGQTNGSENTPQQADHETTSPLSDP